MTGGEFFLTAFVGEVSGVASAALWQAIIYRIGPKIDIAPQIRLVPKDKTNQIKVINRSRRILTRTSGKSSRRAAMM